MSNSEESKSTSINEDKNTATTPEGNNDSSGDTSRNNAEDELLKAQLEAENAVSQAVQDINKTINS